MSEKDRNAANTFGLVEGLAYDAVVAHQKYNGSLDDDRATSIGWVWLWTCAFAEDRIPTGGKTDTPVTEALPEKKQ